MTTRVTIRQEQLSIPTYGVGKQYSNPMFLEQRVYQGSSGEVYPYGVIDTLTGERQPKVYQAVILENAYLRIMLLPELGGRIQQAYDKIKQRDFVYHNEVIKPALVGLLGPWISGGIEFNWPQHHRPPTYMAVDYHLQQRADGACTLWLGEVEPMRGLQVMTGFTLYPDWALLEISCRVFNPNATPRHFLWWANPAVKGGDDHQSVFPPDVTAVFDHGKRDVSSFPIATGTYYKVDYSKGVDISRYRNIPVPTSYMAHHSDYDFVGAYSHDEQGGLLHIADHHIAPGKKQWTWGNCDFGRAWDHNLTDSNGPYIELMTGVYTDNQPNFTWLDTYEEKQFVQYFLPYHTLGMVQNANTQAALKLERQSHGLEWGIYAISSLTDYCLTISSDETASPLLQRQITLQSGEVLRETLTCEPAGRLTIAIQDSQSRPVLSYQEHQKQHQPLPEPAQVPLPPAEISSCDEAWFIGQHLEQYNHASRTAPEYYRRGLELDPGDYRCNLALARLEYNRADLTTAQYYADQALSRAHRLNKNPQCGAASLLRATLHEHQGNFDAAWEDFYRAVWSGNSKSEGFFGLARIATRRGDWQQAMAFIEQSLQNNSANYELHTLHALLLWKQGRQQECLHYIDSTLQRWPLHYSLYYVRYLQTRQSVDLQALRQVTGCRGINAISIAQTLQSFAMKPQALEVLTLLASEECLPLYWRASLLKDSVADSEYLELLQQARQAFPEQVRFPNSVAEVAMLEQLPECYFTHYLLGCFHYSKRNYQKALDCWQQCAEMKPDFAAVWRVIALYYYNKCHDSERAMTYLNKARSLAPEQPRLLFELDCLHKATGVPVAKRLQHLQQERSLVLQRDDLTAELLNLLNLQGREQDALEIIANRHFHPWEGGRAKLPDNIWWHYNDWDCDSCWPEISTPRCRAYSRR